MKLTIFKKLYLLMALPMVIFLAGCDIPLLEAITGASSMEEDLLLENALNPPVVNNDNQVKPPKPKASAKEEEKKEKGIELSKKSAVLDIDVGGRTSLFVPYRERNLKYSSLNFNDLPLPPASGEMDDSLTSLVSAKVTGILFEQESPSAIINVKDSDYLVKPGDKVETFEIADIAEDYVAIKTGTNVYRAKVGDIIEGELVGTGIYNLGHRFAGTYNPANEEDILIVKTSKKSANNQGSSQEAGGLNDLTLPDIPLGKVRVKAQDNGVPLPPAGIDSL